MATATEGKRRRRFTESYMRQRKIFDKLRKMFQDVIAWDYGYLPEDGRLRLDMFEPLEVAELKMRSPWEIQKQRFGICWDFVAVEDMMLRRNRIPHKCYLQVNFTELGSINYHAFVIVSQPRMLLVECANSNFKGIVQVNDLGQDIPDYYEIRNAVPFCGYFVEYSPAKYPAGTTVKAMVEAILADATNIIPVGNPKIPFCYLRNHGIPFKTKDILPRVYPGALQKA